MMMSPASISALAAIFGSIVGALGSGASTWVSQRFQERREFLNKKFAQREQLYSDFISETAKAMLDASEHSLQDPGKLIPMYAPQSDSFEFLSFRVAPHDSRPSWFATPSTCETFTHTTLPVLPANRNSMKIGQSQGIIQNGWEWRGRKDNVDAEAECKNGEASSERFPTRTKI